MVRNDSRSFVHKCSKQKERRFFLMKKMFGRIISLILCVCVCFSLFGCGGTKEDASKKDGKKENTQIAGMSPDNPVRMSIDEWIGYWELLAANGGLETAPDSINAKNGIYITYVPMNDAEVSSNALISNEIQGAGYTVNRYAFLQNKFNNAGVDVVMPFITNYSNGADGIISRSDIVNVSDLVGKKVAAQLKENPVMVKRVDFELNQLRDVMLSLRTQFPDMAVVLGSTFGDKPSLLVALGQNRVDAGKNAGNIVRTAGKEMQGGGGGQPGYATAGGKNLAGLDAAMKVAAEMV